MKTPIELRVNGEVFKLEVEPRRLLLEALHDDLQLTGVRRGCDDGFCGACTVILDGKAVHSCSVLAVSARGKEITTVEGLARNGQYHPLQAAFVEHGALQCGYCTPGMLLTAKALLDKNPQPTELEVRTAISGNLCRCTGYKQIVEAILSVARKKSGLRSAR